MKTYKFEVAELKNGALSVMLITNEKYNEKIGLESKKMSVGDMMREVVENHNKQLKYQAELYEWNRMFKGLSTRQKLEHPLYSHCRSREYGVTIYARCSFSPSGVKSIGGMSHEEERELQTGALSPTEKL